MSQKQGNLPEHREVCLWMHSTQENLVEVGFEEKNTLHLMYSNPMNEAHESSSRVKWVRYLQCPDILLPPNY